MGVVVSVTAIFMECLFFMALMVFVSLGLSLFIMVIQFDISMVQRYQVAETYVDIIDFLMVNGNYIGWTGAAVGVAVVMTVLKTLSGKGIQQQSITETARRLYSAGAVRDGIAFTSDKNGGNEK
jgi:hypothetical protein